MAGALGSAKSQRKERDRLPPFTPLLHSTMDSDAWRALSHGAVRLYVALRRRVPKGRNRAYLSFRQAEAEIRASRRKIAEWFQELRHYGFIVLESHGCLGLNGRGKAPTWRLTELGIAGVEHPTNDFHRWNGVPFKRPGDRRQARFKAFLKKQNPGDGVGNGVVTAWETLPVPASETLKAKSVSHASTIESAETVSHASTITSLPLRASSPELRDDLEIPPFLKRARP